MDVQNTKGRSPKKQVEQIKFTPIEGTQISQKTNIGHDGAAFQPLACNLKTGGVRF
jgi:hypothetical protein